MKYTGISVHETGGQIHTMKCLWEALAWFVVLNIYKIYQLFLTHINPENKIDNKETIALLLHEKDKLKELVPNVGERLLTIKILREVHVIATTS